ncbi:MAG: PAS/PAC sensor hybrid histidine kinase, partial [Ignavibacteria bacterium]
HLTLGLGINVILQLGNHLVFFTFLLGNNLVADIGLTLVRQMTKMMGGEVSVESEKNVGSTFTLKFPTITDKNIKSISDLVQTKTTCSLPYTELPYILIVEDNEMSSMLTKTFLRNKYMVDIAENAVEALKLISKKSYSVVLLDINLGSGMNGIDLLKEIRKHINYSDIPIVAMTGYAFNSDKVNFLNSGFTNYIAKPFSKQQLLFLIEETLNVLV